MLSYAFTERLRRFLVAEHAFFDEDEIFASAGEWNASRVDLVVHDQVGSTSDWLLAHCRGGIERPVACLAERQTAGRGRRGKVWHVAPGGSLAMSIAWPGGWDVAQLPRLPLVVAEALAATLARLGLVTIAIKWPNDLFFRGAKLGGILLDGYGNGEDRNVVIGIGMNYDAGCLPDALRATLPLTDFVSHFGAVPAPSRNALAGRLLRACLHACEGFPGNADAAFDRFRRRYDYCHGRLLDVVTEGEGVVSGVAEGISDEGGLIVRVAGSRRVFYSGDVSVRTVA